MLDYLLAAWIAPLLRRLVVLSLRLWAIAFVVTIPARLWVRYLEPRPSDEKLVTLNAVGVGLLLTAVGFRYYRRTRRAPGWLPCRNHCRAESPDRRVGWTTWR
jgi:hypothetical protein